MKQFNNLQFHLKSNIMTSTENLEVVGVSSVNTDESHDHVSIYAAIEARNLNLLKSLIASGASVNEFQVRVCTPQYFAIEKGDLEIVMALIKGGASVNQACEDDCTPLHAAIKIVV